MGSTNGDKDEKPVHRVTIRYSFYIGKYEVTQAQWQSLMGYNPSHFNGRELPVERVSWNDVQDFINKLNAKDTEYMYRLPTEAEWEYAARAGTTGDYAGDLGALAWYNENSGRARLGIFVSRLFLDGPTYVQRLKENGCQTHSVGSKQPNAFGLFDMHGNVIEWCQDLSHDESYVGGPTDGTAWLTAEKRNLRIGRGGSWANSKKECRSAQRFEGEPGNRNEFTGLRVVAMARW